MNNFDKISAGDKARTELHDALNLTGAEISINSLPAGTGVPFVHSHRNNEEIYAVTEGKGYAIIDGVNIDLKSGDWLRISPSAKRQFFASKDSALNYICIQVKAYSLEGYTMTDAIV